MLLRCVLLACCLLTVLAAGCDTPSRQGNMNSHAVVDWPYAPEDIRVHPLSRVKFDPETNKARVEARVELLDRDGFSTRGIGFLELRLTGSPNTGSHTAVHWQCDLSDLDANGQHYDCVTRTYLARLSIVQAEDVPLEPVLRVTLTLLDGRVLSDTQTIRLATSELGSKTLDN